MTKHVDLMAGPIKIAYCNSDGRKSERVIKPISIYHRYGHTYIKAYCSLAKEVRTFRKDRIITAEPSAPSPESGGIVVKTAASSFSKTDSVKQKKEKRVRFGGVVGTVFSFGLGLLFFLGSGAGQNLFDYLETQAAGRSYSSSYSVLSSAVSKATSSTQETKPHPPTAVTTEEHYRGYTYYKTVKGGAVTYSFLDDSGLDPGQSRFVSRHDINTAINTRCFRKATGITSVTLEQLYSAADSDRNGYISWNEVRRFQRILVMNYRYKNNGIALRPDQFLEENGGDCEDFALVTAGLLRFWNWQPFIGSFAPSEYGTGHAICLVYSDTVPAGCNYYWLSGYSASTGQKIKNGYYIPVDYDYVGETSSAMDKDWTLRSIYVPEDIYGNWM